MKITEKLEEKVQTKAVKGEATTTYYFAHAHFDFLVPSMARNRLCRHRPMARNRLC